jgi:hypothetical protein
MDETDFIKRSMIIDIGVGRSDLTRISHAFLDPSRLMLQTAKVC